MVSHLTGLHMNTRLGSSVSNFIDLKFGKKHYRFNSFVGPEVVLG